MIWVLRACQFHFDQINLYELVLWNCWLLQARGLSNLVRNGLAVNIAHSAESVAFPAG